MTGATVGKRLYCSQERAHDSWNLSDPSKPADPSDSNPEAMVPGGGASDSISETLASKTEGGDVLLVSQAELRRLVKDVVHNVDEPEPADEGIRKSPLSVDDFERVVRRLVELGITWTPKMSPTFQIRRQIAGASKELQGLVAKYPGFQAEFGALVRYVLMGKSMPPMPVVGPPESVEAKSRIISSVLDEEFRSEFFFEQATKVPRFAQLDWEVVVKSAERMVQNIPGTIYALLRLDVRSEHGGATSLAFAANERSLRSMRQDIDYALTALESVRELGPQLRSSKPTEGG